MALVAFAVAAEPAPSAPRPDASALRPIAVPVWLAGAGLPIGVQIIAPAWREDLALRVAYALEEAGVVAAPIASPQEAIA